MSKKGENIYKRKDGRWEARYIKGINENGKTIYGYLYGKTYGEVKEKKLAVMLSCKNENDIVKVKLIFKDVSMKWLESQREVVKESTYAKYFNVVYKYLIPYFGELSIIDINVEKINDFSNYLLKSGGGKKAGLAPKTVIDITSILKNILNSSKRYGISTEYNLHTFKIKKRRNLSLKILSTTEQVTLVDYLLSDLTEKNLGIIICLFTGIRIGELCALKWNDISLTDRTFFIHSTMQRIQNVNSSKGPKTKIIITTPKSICSTRIIPITNSILTVLKKFYTNQIGYVLTGSDDKYMEPRVMQRYFQKIINLLSIEKVSFHALRHTFATRCVENGMDIKILSEILGHSSVNITMNCYVHPSMELKRKQMEKISTYLHC